MTKRIFYLGIGIAAASFWTILRAVHRHLEARVKIMRREQREAINSWENEGGSIAPK